MTGCAGLIANPLSGKDIRRLIAHGAVFDNQQKVNILTRLLASLSTLGVTSVLALDDPYRLIYQAYQKSKATLKLEFLDIELTHSAADSTEAARAMHAAGVNCIIALGGDGTSRAVAKGCDDIPLLPISTGTNNAFPQMVEGTLAGMAAAAICRGFPATAENGIRQTACLEIMQNDEVIDLALVDAVIYDEQFAANRAMWETQKLRSIILPSIRSCVIGMSSVASFLPELQVMDGQAVVIEMGTGGQTILAPIAPGLLQPVSVSNIHTLGAGEKLPVDQEDTVILALDGEREILIRPGGNITVRFNPHGPRVIDVGAVLQAASRQGYFVIPPDERRAPMPD